MLAVLHVSQSGWKNILESHDIVSRLHIGHTFANGLNDTSALMTEDYGEGPLWIFSGKRVRIWFCSASLLLSMAWSRIPV